MCVCGFHKHCQPKFSQNCHWFVAKQCTHDSQSFSPDKGVSVTVCLSAWIGIQNDLIQLLKTTFSLATYESSCAAMDYFSCPQCEWDERLQRPLHNKGSLFLWVDVRPSQQGVLCETDDLGPFLSHFVFPMAGSFYTNRNLAPRQYQGSSLSLSACLQKEICQFSSLRVLLTCLVVSFPYLSAWTSHPPAFLGLRVSATGESWRDLYPPRLLVVCHLQPIKD